MKRFGPAFQERDFTLLWFAYLGMGLSLQMLEVAIGWQVYSIHKSALNLGWIGLAEFLPMFLLALPAGQLADRVPRRLILAFALLIATGVALGLMALTLAHVTALLPFFGLAFCAGISSALGAPAARAMPPTLVPPELLASAMALRAIAGQVGMVAGPALGGFLYPVSPTVVYGAAAAMNLVAAGCVSAMRPRPAADAAAAGRPGAPGIDYVLGGVRFIRRTQILLGAITLDLFAVLFGGAVGLLPVFATILHVGPTGLGILRSAPAVGALLGALILARRPLGRHSGRTLLIVVAAFGASIIVFGLSRSFWLSLLALGVSGFADMFSMNIRSTAVALATPDELRGRVMAVEMVFISASNQLGAFESGLAAFLLGAVPAVVVGGTLTVGLAVVWKRIFPALANMDRLEDVRPEPVEEPVAVALR